MAPPAWLTQANALAVGSPAASPGASTAPSNAPAWIQQADLLKSGQLPAAPAAPQASWLQRLEAFAPGFNSGVADLAGMPMDVAVNLENLGKSGIEAAYLAAGKLPPASLDPVTGAERAQVPLTSAWIKKKFNSTPLGNVTEAPVPSDSISEGVHFLGNLASGALTGDPFESDAARMQLAADRDLVEAGGQVPGQTPSALAQMMQGGLTRAQESAKSAGDKLGLKLTPGQRLGSKPLLQLEAAAAASPWTSGPLGKLAEHNADIMDRVAASSVGAPAEGRVDADTLGAAADRMGDIFNQIRTPDVALNVDPEKSAALVRKLDEDNEGLLPNNARVSDHPLVKTFTGLMDRAAGRNANRNAFIDAYEKASSPVEGSPGMRSMGGVDIAIEPSQLENGAAHIRLIESNGDRAPVALRKVLALADEHGVPLHATANGTGAIPTEALASHYERAGFSRLPATHADNDWIPMRRAPQVTAKQVGQLSSKLSRAAYKQMTSAGGDRDLGKALFALKDHVDDILESNLSGEGKAAYSQAREQYRNLMHLVSRGNIVNTATGHLNPVALASRLKSADRSGYLFGKNQSPLYNVARFGEAFKPIVGDSGTATRSQEVFNPVKWAVGIPAHVAMRAYMSPLGAAAATHGLNAVGRLPEVPGVLGRLLARSPLAAALMFPQVQGR